MPARVQAGIDGLIKAHRAYVIRRDLEEDRGEVPSHWACSCHCLRRCRWVELLPVGHGWPQMEGSLASVAARCLMNVPLSLDALSQALPNFLATVLNYMTFVHGIIYEAICSIRVPNVLFAEGNPIATADSLDQVLAHIVNTSACDTLALQVEIEHEITDIMATPKLMVVPPPHTRRKSTAALKSSDSTSTPAIFFNVASSIWRTISANTNNIIANHDNSNKSNDPRKVFWVTNDP